MKYKWLTWSSAIVEINKVPKDFIVNDVCWLTAFLSGSTWKVEISRSSKRRILCYTKNPILQRSTPEKQTCKGLERAFREHWSSPWSLTNSCLSHIHNCTENKIDRAHFPLRGSTKHEMLSLNALRGTGGPEAQCNWTTLSSLSDFLEHFHLRRCKKLVGCGCCGQLVCKHTYSGRVRTCGLRTLKTTGVLVSLSSSSIIANNIFSTFECSCFKSRLKLSLFQRQT